ncbi:MAG: hypothetical protein K2K37_09120 [Muribaculaceae bacterium]|nr:hypothetical protein [Muribaculaceae bacterium]
MKKLLSFILVMIALALQSIAQESSSSPSTTRIELETQQTKNSSHPVHRAPMHIDIEAYYDEESGTLDICYDGEAIGETFLYLNDNIIGYDCEINTSFQIAAPGLYKIEIIAETWIAQGYIQI